MSEADFLVLLDREVERLTGENDHSAAVLLREAGRRLRALRRGQTDLEALTFSISADIAKSAKLD